MKKSIAWPGDRFVVTAGVPFDRAGLASVLIAYGTGVRMGMQEPEVIATYRLVLHEVPRDMAMRLHRALARRGLGHLVRDRAVAKRLLNQGAS